MKGLSFSPLNKLLMCSVGLDRQIIFYDIHDKLIVKKIVAPFPISSVHFSTDGHTLAVGSSMNGMSQQCLVYDLRKSSSITLPLVGHESAVNSVRFTSRIDDLRKSGATNFKSNVQPKEPIKTVVDIRKEAQARVSLAKEVKP